MKARIFAKLPTSKLFFRCAIPSMVTMVFSALYQMADGLFVGRFIGLDALAAVSLVTPVIMTVFAFSNMIATGASVRISILLGEKKQQEASCVFSFTIKAIFLLSCIIGSFGFLFAEPLTRLFSPGATEQAVEYGTVYIRVYALFSPLVPMFFATDNFLRVCGKQYLCMWLNIGTQILNIALDIILIAVLDQGVWAAAFTSCFAMAIGSFVTLCLFRKRRLDLYYTRENIHLSVFLHILANGFSEFFSNISISVMAAVYNFFLLKYGGTTGVAAFSVIMYVDSIAGMLLFGMCDSLQPAISYCYGARLLEKVKAIFKYMIISSILLSLLAMFFMMFAGRYIAPLFIRPEDVKLLAVSIAGMELFSLSYITGWVDMSFSSFFTALDRPVRSLLTSFFGTIVFPIVFLFLLTPVWQLNGVFLTTIAANTASAVLAILFALTMKIKNENCETINSFPRK